MPIYVYSTLSNDQSYTTYTELAGGVPQKDQAIFIAGKANVANNHFITPLGMITEVTAEQLAELRRNPVFRMHEQNGHISVSQAKADPDQVAASMQGRDASAPLVDQDFAEGEAPTTGKVERKQAR
ncbi:hypothetical protein NRB16_24500 [Pseudomonas sp. LJDD11]|uniref:hypothetical protein n=1 Tax=Pseudomonas sp. LJDD11 TaxID=2931984 RepID=UPI00211CABE7|nr:hypothetical protein [Pseudomonas sp. LJDD11]MCQ9426685.1 hypothetical protein [Pseudomonas sp. LJDD11]